MITPKLFADWESPVHKLNINRIPEICKQLSDTANPAQPLRIDRVEIKLLLDRTLQLDLMRKMASTYPLAYDFSDEVRDSSEDVRNKIYANLFYLQSHELLEPKSINLTIGFGGIQNSTFTLNFSRLTHKGADFMANDGGLSAILGVVTVKFEAEQLKLLLESKVMATDLPPADKRKLIDGLRSLSAESIKHLTTKIVDLGWDNLGTLTRIIQNSLP